MKKLISIILLAAAMSLGTGCKVRFRDDIHDHTFSVPKLTSAECSKIILHLLGKRPGIEEVKPDLDHGTLFVRFNSRVIALKNIEYALSENGFDVDDSVGRASAKAKLPASCR